MACISLPWLVTHQKTAGPPKPLQAPLPTPCNDPEGSVYVCVVALCPCTPSFAAPPPSPCPQAHTHQSEHCRSSWSAWCRPWPHASCTCCAQTDTEHTHTRDVKEEFVFESRCNRRAVSDHRSWEAADCLGGVLGCLAVWLVFWLAGWRYALGRKGCLDWDCSTAADAKAVAPDAAPARRASWLTHWALLSWPGLC